MGKCAHHLNNSRVVSHIVIAGIEIHHRGYIHHSGEVPSFLYLIGGNDGHSYIVGAKQSNGQQQP